MKIISLLILLLSSATQASEKQCSAYQIDETRKFSDHALIGFFGGPKIAYQVTRLATDKYLLEVNPTFFDPAPVVTALNTKEIDFKERPFGRARAEECFQWFNETYAETLSPKIFLGVSKGPTPVSIKIKDDLHYRSYSRQYNLSQLEKSCPFVVHESLHLMGLWDEYNEQGKDKHPGILSFDCRSESDSIMSDYSIYDKKVELASERLVCACRENDSECLRKNIELFLTHPDLVEKCPAWSEEVIRTKYSENAFFLDQANKVTSDINSIWAPASPGQLSSAMNFPSGKLETFKPLRPAHIRQLLYPNCTEMNPVYKSCIQNAYRSHGTVLNCKSAPAICGQKNLWLE